MGYALIIQEVQSQRSCDAVARVYRIFHFFEKITPNFFNISDILGEKLKYFVFWAPQNSQSFRISEQKISVPVPVTYVSLHGPITLLEGHHNPLKKN